MEGHFECNVEEKTFTHDMKTSNLPKMLQGLKEKKIDFTIKKKKFFGATNLETASVNLSPFGAHSVIEKNITLQGARVGVHLMIHKATRVKEYERIGGTKLGVGPILPPFKSM